MATHKQQLLKKLGLPKDSTFSVEKIAEIMDLPVEALQEVYNRGIGAYSNLASVRLKKDYSKNPDTKKYPRSARLGKEEWAMSRLYSFLNKGKTFNTTDADIARRYKIV
jgi:hypothetical protein